MTNNPDMDFKLERALRKLAVADSKSYEVLADAVAYVHQSQIENLMVADENQFRFHQGAATVLGLLSEAIDDSRLTDL